MGLYMLHRNPNVFPEPEKFIPERFSEQKSHDKKNAFSYVPFSGGYRNCIGKHFFIFTESKCKNNFLQQDNDLLN